MFKFWFLSILCVFSVLTWLNGRTAQAVVVASTTLNNSAPIDDPGWANVGELRNSTAVYLGNRWVISAAHVGVGNVTFPGLGEFEPDTTTRFQFLNPTGMGLSVETDLIMFQLEEDPGLPPVALPTRAPTPGTEVVMIGHGRDREDQITHWNVSKRSPRWIWEESSAPADFSGFKLATTSNLRWGTNLIEDDELFFREFDDDIHHSVETTADVLSLITEFDFFDGNSDESIVSPSGDFSTNYESQAVINDSGGALFYRQDGLWRLGGIMVAVEGFRDQPDATRHAIYGNLTFAADLSVYGPQADSRYRHGDVNGDGVVDVADLNLLAIFTNNEPYVAAADLNRDGSLSLEDRQILVREGLRTFFGDSNLDGEFGTSDLITVLQAGQYEDAIEGNSTWKTGDWNGDFDFSTADLVLAFGDGGFENGVFGDRRDNNPVAVVPEPGLSPLFFSVFLLIVNRWHANRRGRPGDAACRLE